MKATVTREQMIDYLQNKLDRFKVLEEKYGFENEYVSEFFDEMIACKEMAEVLLGEPVNLGLNGKVTVGF